MIAFDSQCVFENHLLTCNHYGASFMLCLYVIYQYSISFHIASSYVFVVLYNTSLKKLVRQEIANFVSLGTSTAVRN